MSLQHNAINSRWENPFKIYISLALSSSFHNISDRIFVDKLSRERLGDSADRL